MLMQDLSQITVAEMTARLKARAFEARKRETERALDYYWGIQLPYLEGLIDADFGANEAESLRRQATFVNFVRRVVDELSLVYKRAPLRRFSPDAQEQARWEALYRDVKADLVFKRLNAYVNLLGLCFLRVAWRKGRVALDVLTPNLVDVVQDEEDPTHAKALVVAQTLADSPSLETVFSYWGEDGRHLRFDTWGKPRPLPGNPDGVNPYRDAEGNSVLPFVVLRRDPPDGRFFVEGMGELLAAQELINLKLTELSYLIKMQSYGQPIFKGMDDEQKSVAVGPGKPIRIPLSAVAEGADFRFESPNGQIAEVWAFIKEYMAFAANQYGLASESFSLTGGVKSGLALSLENRRLTERRENDMETYRAAESELFELIRIVHNAHAPETPLSEAAELGLEFGEAVSAAIGAGTPLTA